MTIRRAVRQRCLSPGLSYTLAYTWSKAMGDFLDHLSAGGGAVGIGAGQMSRVDSCRIAVWKAQEAGLSLKGSIVASDAMFPFPDGLMAAADAGAARAAAPQ